VTAAQNSESRPVGTDNARRTTPHPGGETDIGASEVPPYDRRTVGEVNPRQVPQGHLAAKAPLENPGSLASQEVPDQQSPPARHRGGRRKHNPQRGGRHTGIAASLRLRVGDARAATSQAPERRGLQGPDRVRMCGPGSL
jgi:hypothetical protein